MDVEQCTRLMMQGGEFWKYHYRQVGRPARVVVQLIGPAEDQVIAWRDHGEQDFAASIPLSDIVDIRKGPHSRTFSENQASVINPSLCFSIYTRGRTLDLEAVHPEDLRVWFGGIKYRLQATMPAGPGDVRYTEINSRTREEWHYDGGRMVQRAHGGGGSYDGGYAELLQDLEHHLDVASQNDPLDAIEEWLQIKRRTTRTNLGPPPPSLDVDEWFRQEAQQGQRQQVQSVPLQSYPAASTQAPAHAGASVSAIPAPPVGGYGYHTAQQPYGYGVAR